jgi:hypothetical protein
MVPLMSSSLRGAKHMSAATGFLWTAQAETELKPANISFLGPETVPRLAGECRETVN